MNKYLKIKDIDRLNRIYDDIDEQITRYATKVSIISDIIARLQSELSLFNCLQKMKRLKDVKKEKEKYCNMLKEYYEQQADVQYAIDTFDENKKKFRIIF